MSDSILETNTLRCNRIICKDLDALDDRMDVIESAGSSATLSARVIENVGDTRVIFGLNDYLLISATAAAMYINSVNYLQVTPTNYSIGTSGVNSLSITSLAVATLTCNSLTRLLVNSAGATLYSPDGLSYVELTDTSAQFVHNSIPVVDAQNTYTLFKAAVGGDDPYLRIDATHLIGVYNTINRFVVDDTLSYLAAPNETTRVTITSTAVTGAVAGATTLSMSASGVNLGNVEGTAALDITTSNIKITKSGVDRLDVGGSASLLKASNGTSYLNLATTLAELYVAGVNTLNFTSGNSQIIGGTSSVELSTAYVKIFANAVSRIYLNTSGTGETLIKDATSNSFLGLYASQAQFAIAGVARVLCNATTSYLNSPNNVNRVAVTDTNLDFTVNSVSKFNATTTDTAVSGAAGESVVTCNATAISALLGGNERVRLGGAYSRISSPNTTTYSVWSDAYYNAYLAGALRVEILPSYTRTYFSPYYTTLSADGFRIIDSSNSNAALLDISNSASILASLANIQQIVATQTTTRLQSPNANKEIELTDTAINITSDSSVNVHGTEFTVYDESSVEMTGTYVVGGGTRAMFTMGGGGAYSGTRCGLRFNSGEGLSTWGMRMVNLGGTSGLGFYYNSDTLSNPAIAHITSTGTYVSSDRTLKKDITRLDKETTLLNLCSLQPSQFKYIHDPSRVATGFIAQEAQTHFPHTVLEIDGKLAMSTNLSAELVASVQCLNEKIAALQARVAALEA